MNRKEISPELIQRYLKGACSPVEARQLEDWFHSFDEEPDLLHTMNSRQQLRLNQRMLGEIKARIEEAEGVTWTGANPGRPISRQMPARWQVITGVAAAVALVLGIAFSFYLGGKEKSTIAQQAVTSMIACTNDARTLRKQVLEDGSIVWLHPGSRLDYPITFATHKREVSLSGEAFFEISRNPKRPFIIHSGSLLTTVLGTSFSIKAYRNAPSAEVSVVTGKVAVQLIHSPHSQGKEVLLTPHQKAMYVKEGNQLSKEEILSSDRRNMWAASELSFENASVQEVIRAFNHHFDVVIQVQNKNLLNCKVHGDFNGQNLPAILEILGQTIEATYEINGKEIMLKGNGCIH